MSNDRGERYLEDLVPGQVYGGPSLTLDEAAIRTFASEWDNQPFHTDPVAATRSLFGGLAASGWHTAAATMKLLVAGDLRLAGGLIGGGLEQLSWPKPVRPGDTLTVQAEILEVRPSKSNPSRGVVRVRSTTLNQQGEAVQIMVSVMMVARRLVG
jgi:acyl dehydratase